MLNYSFRLLFIPFPYLKKIILGIVGHALPFTLMSKCPGYCTVYSAPLRSISVFYSSNVYIAEKV